MREFSKVSPKVWQSKRFRHLEGDADKLLYLFLLTCSHQTSAGSFRLPAAYAAVDLGWTEDGVLAGIDRLGSKDLLVWDGDTEEVFVNRWFKHNPPTNGNYLKGVKRIISDIESDAVREAAETELQEHLDNRSPLDDSPGTSNSPLANTRYVRGGRSS